MLAGFLLVAEIRNMVGEFGCAEFPPTYIIWGGAMARSASGKFTGTRVYAHLWLAPAFVFCAGAAWVPNALSCVWRGATFFLRRASAGEFARGAAGAPRGERLLPQCQQKKSSLMMIN